jgi:hypothetical protein
MSGRTGVALAAVLLGAAVLAAIPVRGRMDARAVDAAPDCRVGAEPTHPYGEQPPEDFLRYGTRPVVIGCATLASDRRVELVGYQLGRGKHTSLCIDHYYFDTGETSGCGSNVVHGGGAIDATSTVRSTTGPAVVSGTVTRSVARVVVRSELRGRLRRDPTALVKVRDRALLHAIGVDHAFGRYLAEVAPPSRAVTAEAFDGRPRTLGIAFFEGFGRAIGEGQACYTRPRVARLRLLAPARVREANRIRIVANYPGGYIGSVQVGVGGRTVTIADLGPTQTRRDDGRRVVTLPIGFRRRGTVGVDVTAEGVPLSRRCGERPPLRRSAPRTLPVRVR